MTETKLEVLSKKRSVICKSERKVADTMMKENNT